MNSKLIEDFQSIDEQDLNDICKFMKLFQETIESLSEDERPTIHRVIPLRQYLLNICHETSDASMAICQLKSFIGK